MIQDNLSPLILDIEKFRHYIETFNRQDEELYVEHVPNAGAWKFLSENIPLFDCPDKELELNYYFRWWTYRKHIKRTPEGFVITEFLPNVGWAGKYNTVNLTACLHYMEGRWLADRQYMDAYARFWFRQGGTLNGPRAYTCWHAFALRQMGMAYGDAGMFGVYLDDMVGNYRAWEKGWDYKEWLPSSSQEVQTRTFHRGRCSNGMFFEIDGYEGTECSIAGHGYRPLINSAMFGEAMAIADFACRQGRMELAEEFSRKAADLKNLVDTRLWCDKDQFYKVMGIDGQTLADVREIWGYTPWYFNLPDPGREIAWGQLTDSDGFAAPYGPTCAEQRHSAFTVSYEGHECQWNGPSWPLMTSMALTALANMLNGKEQNVIGKRSFYDTLMSYARAHRRVREDGSIVPWIDEDINPFTGDWIARSRLSVWKDGTWSEEKGGKERGKDYNHSTFCDLIITGLVGLRPREDNMIEVNPLLPENAWDYFCLDRIPYHGRILTILWDRNGGHYGRGAGLQVFLDGQVLMQSRELAKIVAKLP